MQCFSFVGPSGLLGMRLALSSMPVVGRQATKLPWALRAFQNQACGAPARASGRQFLRQHFTLSLRPSELQRSPHWGFSPGPALGLVSAIGGIGYLCGDETPGGAATALAAAMLVNFSILVHEAGHLAAARAMGVAVQEFSVGIGPRVAWWQGTTTTYCLRAIPLLGFVRFLTPATAAAAAAAAAGGAAGAAAAACVYGSSGHAAAAAATSQIQAQARRLLFLESLPPGRRAVVMAAGVAANVLLAAAFVAWQVLSCGEMDTVVRPGVRIHAAAGWTGGGDEGEAGDGEGATTVTAAAEAAMATAAPPLRQRLQAGDVVLSVGQWKMPTGGALDAALVTALRAAAKERALSTAAESSDESSGTADQSNHDDTQSALGLLDGVKMAVLRTCTADNGSGGLVPSRTVLQLDAADLLRYDSLQVTPNARLGYRLPIDAWEALEMSGRELASWWRRVVGCWTELLSDVTGRSGAAASGSQFVGPLGLVASATEFVAGEKQFVQGGGSGSSGSSGSTGGADDGCERSSSSSASSSLSAENRAFLDESIALQQPHPLLSLGVQLNLQLVLFNLLPIPALDGGQLLLVAIEALRGGRRLSLPLERAALLGSAALMGCWLAALSVRDVVGLADRAANRLAAAVEPHYGKYGVTYGVTYGSSSVGGGDGEGDGDQLAADVGSEAAAAVTTASLAL